jgi:glycosyltransferase involved in cell wall biosynthesis
MAEAMYLGKPVIATAYSGNMDFMDVNTALLVRYKLVELQEDYGPYKKGNYWADPDIDHAAEQMRRLVDDRAFAKQLGCTAREHIHTNHNLEASARDIKARLERIQSF